MSYKEYQNQKVLSAERKPLLQDVDTTSEDNVTIDPKTKSEADKFSRLFLTVYALVMASDWLQGKISFISNVPPLTITQGHMCTAFTKTSLVSKKSSSQHSLQPVFSQAECPVTSLVNSPTNTAGRRPVWYSASLIP